MNSKNARIALHLCTAIIALGFLLFTDQNARVLLYAHILWNLFRLTTVNFICLHRINPNAAGLLNWTTRPTKQQKSEPFMDSRDGKPAGLIVYYSGSLGIVGALGSMLVLTQGTDFAQPETLIREIVLASLIALLFLLDDILSKTLIVDPEADTPKNLGYNTAAILFLLFSLFICIPIVIFGSMIAAAIDGNLLWMDAFILVLITLLKLTADIRQEIKQDRGFSRLSEYEK